MVFWYCFWLAFVRLRVVGLVCCLFLRLFFEFFLRCGRDFDVQRDFYGICSWNFYVAKVCGGFLCFGLNLVSFGRLKTLVKDGRGENRPYWSLVGDDKPRFAVKG